MHTPSIISVAAIASALLLDTAWAMLSSLSFHEEMAAKRAPQSSNTKDFRFLTNKTSKYRVESLPEVNFDIGEMYSGLIPIEKRKNESRELFFVFQPTIGAPVDEITIFLNGGPGCSSLQAFLQENGRFLWTPGTFAPVENPYSWVNLTNMLWVDQPIGAGYSVGTPTAVSQEETAQDFVKFFKNFEVLFGIKKFKIYLSGESYAGRYVPYISAAFIEQQDTEYFDLQGALLYDPTIGEALTTQLMVPTYPTVKENNNLFSLNQSQLAELEELHKSCGFEAYIDKYLTFPASGVQPISYVPTECDVATWTLKRTLANNPCFSMYDISSTCPILWDVLGAPTVLSYVPNGAEIYFDRPDVQKALHAPKVNWIECSASKTYLGDNGKGGSEANGDLSLDPIQHVLPRVIEHTNRVLVSNGDYDMIIQTNGTLLSIQNMTWNGQLGFDERPSKPINIQTPDLMYQETFGKSKFAGFDGPQGEMGVQHYERGLMWAETYQAGHMQPQYQPRVSLRHLEWVLGRIEEL